ncbi:putative Flp pilus-assembly TadE/G-like protein [Streptomyces sp. TLI_55]|uniref:pilus assembly protein TadG-related protein n=1 Tax=Streptomyces sp. TLI_55 TaxID=1938861 RepID=UPI000BC7ACE1|nr:pilus assembly protein TadG-related protein [Streptomyces sp. TLI_55]SNX63720.1 putative Flp pilus-assembly TadE/G-like protein [Streptomyces sp. TLI_55]
MRGRARGDTGQAFPIYITVVGGLLFLAFAYLAVGQAAANKNGAQTAADAAALAAAQDRRDQLAGQWVTDVLDPTKWQDIFDGNAEGLDPSCGRADQLAAQNDAVVLVCDPEGPLAFTVEVQTNKSVGESVIPGTENKRSKASATAEIESRCTFEPPGEDAADDVLPRLTCKDGENWDLDPEQLGDLPKPEDLFDVHLAD